MECAQSSLFSYIVYIIQNTIEHQPQTSVSTLCLDVRTQIQRTYQNIRTPELYTSLLRHCNCHRGTSTISLYPYMRVGRLIVDNQDGEQ